MVDSDLRAVGYRFAVGNSVRRGSDPALLDYANRCQAYILDVLFVLFLVRLSKCICVRNAMANNTRASGDSSQEPDRKRIME